MDISFVSFLRDDTFVVDAGNDWDGWVANKARKTDFHSGWSFPVRYAPWPVRQHALALGHDQAKLTLLWYLDCQKSIKLKSKVQL